MTTVSMGVHVHTKLNIVRFPTNAKLMNKTRLNLENVINSIEVNSFFALIIAIFMTPIAFMTALYNLNKETELNHLVTMRFSSFYIYVFNYIYVLTTIELVFFAI